MAGCASSTWPTRRPPVEVGFYDTPGAALGVAVAGSYAYVADGAAGLRVINVANPAAPSEVGFYDTPGIRRGVAVAGSYAYVADTDTAVCASSTSPTRPHQPRSVSTTRRESAPGWRVAGSYAYVADWGGGLRVINVANPAAPGRGRFYDTPGYAHGVAVAGSYAYVADGWQRAAHRQRGQPGRAGRGRLLRHARVCRGVAVAGSYAYVADRRGGLRIINVPTRRAPAEVGFYDTPGVRRWRGGGGQLRLRRRLWGAAAHHQRRQPGRAGEVRPYAAPGQWGVAVAGSYAYVADSAGAAHHQRGQPGRARRGRVLSTPTGRQAAWPWPGSYAYVADSEGRACGDDQRGQSGGAQRGRAIYDTPGLWPTGVAVAGGYAYVADDGWGDSLILRFVTGQPAPTATSTQPPSPINTPTPPPPPHRATPPSPS